MEIGDIVIVEGCVTNDRGASEHAAIVTRVLSRTEINCVVLIDSPIFNPHVERGLLHQSVQPTGKRFRLKGEAP